MKKILLIFLIYILLICSGFIAFISAGKTDSKIVGRNNFPDPGVLIPRPYQENPPIFIHPCPPENQKDPACIPEYPKKEKKKKKKKA
jgi:hypothetical protein